MDSQGESGLDIGGLSGKRRVVAQAVVALFLLEAAIMVGLHQLPWLPPAAKVLLDALLLAGFALPLFGLVARERTRQRATEAGERGKGRDQYALLFEASLDAVILADRDGKIVDCNRTTRTMFGYSLEELRGQSLVLLMPPRYRDRHSAAFERHARTGVGRHGPRKFEFEGVRKDGSEFPVEVNFDRITPGGEVRFVGTIRDLSERARIEQESQLIRAELQRSHKLQVAGIMASAVAHEFNNLLTSIAGNAELARRQLESMTSSTESMDQILKASARAESCAQRILDLGRRHRARPHPIEINAAVRETMGLLRPSFGDTMEVRLELCPEPCWVPALPGDVDLILTNLVFNARDAMLGGGTLTVQTTQEAEICLSVTDTGEGVPPELAGEIFEPFVSTRVEDGKGTGLGLFVVRSLVEASGGALELESEPGQGATFLVRLPRCEPADGAD